jgi:hypothetical protein
VVNKKQQMEMQEERDLFVRRVMNALNITKQEAEVAADKFFKLPSNEQAAYLDDLDALEASQQREEAFDDFLKFLILNICSNKFSLPQNSN